MLVRHDIPSLYLGTKRRITVWLPPGFNRRIHRQRYPVLYLNDGQNLFDPARAFRGKTWRVAEVAAAPRQAPPHPAHPDRWHRSRRAAACARVPAGRRRAKSLRAGVRSAASMRSSSRESSCRTSPVTIRSRVVLPRPVSEAPHMARFRALHRTGQARGFRQIVDREPVALRSARTPAPHGTRRKALAGARLPGRGHDGNAPAGPE